jgi:hypothetical protein
MSARKATHHFGLAEAMALFAIFPLRLNPDSATTIDIAAMVFFGLLAVIFVAAGIRNLRKSRSKEPDRTET